MFDPGNHSWNTRFSFSLNVNEHYKPRVHKLEGYLYHTYIQHWCNNQIYWAHLETFRKHSELLKHYNSHRFTGHLKTDGPLSWPARLCKVNLMSLWNKRWDMYKEKHQNDKRAPEHRGRLDCGSSFSQVGCVENSVVKRQEETERLWFCSITRHEALAVVSAAGRLILELKSLFISLCSFSMLKSKLINSPLLSPQWDVIELALSYSLSLCRNRGTPGDCDHIYPISKWSQLRSWIWALLSTVSVCCDRELSTFTRSTVSHKRDKNNDDGSRANQ